MMPPLLLVLLNVHNNNNDDSAAMNITDAHAHPLSTTARTQYRSPKRTFDESSASGGEDLEGRGWERSRRRVWLCLGAAETNSAISLLGETLLPKTTMGVAQQQQDVVDMDAAVEDDAEGADAPWLSLTCSSSSSPGSDGEADEDEEVTVKMKMKMKGGAADAHRSRLSCY